MCSCLNLFVDRYEESAYADFNVAVREVGGGVEEGVGGYESSMGRGAAAATSTTSSEGGTHAGERGVGGGGGGGDMCCMSMGTLVASHWPFYQVCFNLLNTLKQICRDHTPHTPCHRGRNGCNGQKRNHSLLWQARASLWGLLMITPTSTHFADLLRNPVTNVDTESGEGGEDASRGVADGRAEKGQGGGERRAGRDCDLEAIFSGSLLQRGGLAFQGGMEGMEGLGGLGGMEGMEGGEGEADVKCGGEGSWMKNLYNDSLSQPDIVYAMQVRNIEKGFKNTKFVFNINNTQCGQ